MKDNFDKNLKELNPEDKTGNISLDEIIQEYYRDSNFVSWRWNTAYTKFLDKSIILDKLRKLINDRLFIDKHLLVNRTG